MAYSTVPFSVKQMLLWESYLCLNVSVTQQTKETLDATERGAFLCVRVSLALIFHVLLHVSACG